MRPYLVSLVCIALISGPGLSAQSNDVLDDFLEGETAPLDQSAWLVFIATDRLPPDAEPSQAMEMIRSDERLSAKISTDDPHRPISFGEFSFLAMESFDLPGGVFYTLFPGPRYAAREMKWRGWILGTPKENSLLAPWDVTTSLSEILDWRARHDT